MWKLRILAQDVRKLLEYNNGPKVVLKINKINNATVNYRDSKAIDPAVNKD